MLLSLVCATKRGMSAQTTTAGCQSGKRKSEEYHKQLGRVAHTTNRQLTGINSTKHPLAQHNLQLNMQTKIADTNSPRHHKRICSVAEPDHRVAAAYQKRDSGMKDRQCFVSTAMTNG
jgi:hypothetical protein